uniref:Uncharacterized protein n=1 Tax=Steinernema glaseri TaxID=37863 RepID=A0A1I7Y9N2_9BILA
MWTATTGHKRIIVAVCCRRAKREIRDGDVLKSPLHARIDPVDYEVPKEVDAGDRRTTITMADFLLPCSFQAILWSFRAVQTCICLLSGVTTMRVEAAAGGDCTTPRQNLAYGGGDDDTSKRPLGQAVDVFMKVSEVC